MESEQFFGLLLSIDGDCARRTRLNGCRCGEALDRADYPRKPRGCPESMRESFSSRFSFCCRVCRRRTTAPSVRFLGRRVYLGWVVVLAAARHAGQQPAARELEALCAALAVPLRTVKRWCRWWREAFVRTPLWSTLGAQFVPALPPSSLPGAVLGRLQGTFTSALSSLLQRLAPLSVRVQLP